MIQQHPHVTDTVPAPAAGAVSPVRPSDVPVPADLQAALDRLEALLDRADGLLTRVETLVDAVVGPLATTTALTTQLTGQVANQVGDSLRRGAGQATAAVLKGVQAGRGLAGR